MWKVLGNFKAMCCNNSQKLTQFSTCIFSEKGVICPVKTFKLYRMKLNPKLDKLWQKPRQANLTHSTACWYEARFVGHDPLDRFMLFLSRQIPLSKEYTNHCIRATCIKNLDEAGVEGRHIITLSDHTSESSLKHYSVNCPDKKKEEMSAILQSKLIPSTSGRDTPPVQQQEIPTINPAELKLDLWPTDDEEDLFLSTIDFNALEQILPGNAAGKENKQQQQQQQQQQQPQPGPSAVTPLNVPRLQSPALGTIPQFAAQQSNIMNQAQMPIHPRMYFPNSSVNINYNFYGFPPKWHWLCVCFVRKSEGNMEKETPCDLRTVIWKRYVMNIVVCTGKLEKTKLFCLFVK